MARSRSRKKKIGWQMPPNVGNGENPSKADLKEIDLIRSKLVVNGRVRLDLEALAVYLMVPSLFRHRHRPRPRALAIAISRQLRATPRLPGVAPVRQKSIITARKVCCFAMTNPGTTTLVLAPTLRQVHGTAAEDRRRVPARWAENRVVEPISNRAQPTSSQALPAASSACLDRTRTPAHRRAAMQPTCWFWKKRRSSTRP